MPGFWTCLHVRPELHVPENLTAINFQKLNWLRVRLGIFEEPNFWRQRGTIVTRLLKYLCDCCGSTCRRRPLMSTLGQN